MEKIQSENLTDANMNFQDCFPYLCVSLSLSHTHTHERTHALRYMKKRSILHFTERYLLCLKASSMFQKCFSL